MSSLYHETSIAANPRGDKNETNFYIDPKDRKNWAFVCSVYPGTFHQSTVHGDYIIPGKPDGKPYSFVIVKPGYTKRDMGDGQRYNDMNIPSRTVAEDVIRDIEHRGVFIPKGEIATDEEVRAAIARRDRQWLTVDIPEADKVWARFKDPAKVDDNAKLAAKTLGLRDKEWAGFSKMSEVEPCPDCKEEIRIGAVVCKHCGLRGITWNGAIPQRPEPAAVAQTGARR